MIMVVLCAVQTVPDVTLHTIQLQCIMVSLAIYYGSWLTVATMRPHGPAIAVRCGQETSECDDPGCSVHAGSWRGEHTTIQEPGATKQYMYMERAVQLSIIMKESHGPS